MKQCEKLIISSKKTPALCSYSLDMQTTGEGSGGWRALKCD